jgi:hypothetical protein
MEGCDITRIVLDIPHGVGLGDEGPVDIVAAAVAAERERCARVCQDLAEEWDQKGYWDEKDALGEAANAIHKGGE